MNPLFIPPNTLPLQFQLNFVTRSYYKLWIEIKKIEETSEQAVTLQTFLLFRDFQGYVYIQSEGKKH